MITFVSKLLRKGLLSSILHTGPNQVFPISKSLGEEQSQWYGPASDIGVASKGYYVSVSQWEWNRASMEESGMEKRIRTQGGIMQEQDGCEVKMKESWKVCEGLRGWLRKRWWWWWWWWWSCDSTFNIWLEKGVLGKTRNRPSFSLPQGAPSKWPTGVIYNPYFLWSYRPLLITDGGPLYTKSEIGWNIRTTDSLYDCSPHQPLTGK